MPIRAGSGGLKYPLPSQAQLQAQQAAAAASAGGSAAASVYGANRRYSSDMKQMQFNAMQAEMDRGFKAEQAFYDREHQMGGQLEQQAARLEAQRRGFLNQQELQQNSQEFQGRQAIVERDFRSSEAEKNRGFTTDRDKAEFERKREEFDWNRGAAYQKGEFIPDPASKRELDKLESGKTAPEYVNGTPDQKAEFMRKYEARKREILRNANPAPRLTPGDQYDKSVINIDPTTGKRYDNDNPAPAGVTTKPYYVNPKTGKPEPLVDDSKDKAKQAEKQAREQAKQDTAQKNWVTRRAAKGEKLAAEWNKENESKTGFVAKKGSDFIKEAEAELALEGFDKPQAPAAPAAGGQGQAPAAPAGMPAGAQPIDDNTVQLPNGRRAVRANGAASAPPTGSYTNPNAFPDAQPVRAPLPGQPWNGANIPANPQPWQYTPPQGSAPQQTPPSHGAMITRTNPDGSKTVMTPEEAGYSFSSVDILNPPKQQSQAPEQQQVPLQKPEQDYLDKVQAQSPNSPLTDEEKHNLLLFYRRKQKAQGR
jgi:hypothetical protein